ncbi:MAG: hypothetical protein ACK5JH_10075 [Anaerocolumna sp.]
MKKINIIMHYPDDEQKEKGVQDITNQFYLKSVESILSKSSLSNEIKKCLLDEAISNI